LLCHMARYKSSSIFRSDVLHIFAKLQVIFIWRTRFEAVVASVADFRLGTFCAPRLVDAVIKASRSYALTASVEEPPVRTCAHTRAVIAAGGSNRNVILGLRQLNFKVAYHFIMLMHGDM
jgi:hypothetical protein